MKPLLEVRNLTKTFKVGNQTLTAIRNLNLNIHRGETLGLVGESGCGKSTVGRTILHLHEPTSGDITFDSTDLSKLSRIDLKQMRRRMQIIFQDPYASLNPRMTVQDIVGEPLDIHKTATGIQRKRRIEKMLNLVGLNPSHMSRFPHEFSGGQRQRIGIARALCIEPEFLILDEPISALDVSIQAQVVNLLKQLQKQMGLTYLFIAHDLSVIKYISDRVAVMYLGELVELAPAEMLYRDPLHPYTQALLSAIPIPDPKIEQKRERIVLKGEVPSPLTPSKGCPFKTRCPKATAQCSLVRPRFKEVKSGHFTACHLF
ncbi:MAG: Oligopeptide transport ATP-binding protein OppF [Chlamydiales bacterium]|nr:Oligopeptide transport ATP-binding protein OppF [Chlamydiales bacterium]MCH9620444.1 Oligopeptide transport ATP-binding protein OppF [Chlamydiales bacterium]MCH9623430.1 Oligopeptide transport ATP-binding protein OppF [Chlamydiales bacterium]